MASDKSTKSLNIKSLWLKESVISDTQPDDFHGRRNFVELGHFDKRFVKNKTKKGLAGKRIGVFLPRYF